MRTYVISLEEPSTDLMQMLRNNTLDPVWVPGVNGKHRTDEQLRIAATPIYSILGPRSAIGIALAHMRAWYTMITNNDQYALVAEDDIVLMDKFPQRLSVALNAMPTDTDILAIGCYGCDTRVNPFSIGFWLSGKLRDWSKYREVNAEVVEPLVAVGTHAYIITNAGARKLLELFDGTIHTHVDAQIQECVQSDGIRYYALRDRIAHQTSGDSNLQVSANTTSSFPRVITDTLKTIYLDQYFTADYTWNLSLLRIGNVNIPSGVFICTILALFACAFGAPAWAAILAIVILGIPDILTTGFDWKVFVMYVVAVSLGAGGGTFIYQNPRSKRFVRV